MSLLASCSKDSVVFNDLQCDGDQTCQSDPDLKVESSDETTDGNDVTLGLPNSEEADIDITDDDDDDDDNITDDDDDDDDKETGSVRLVVSQ